MKKLLLLLLLVTVQTIQLNAQVAVNTDGSTPDPSAALDVKSTSKGFLVPRMTTVQRTAISSAATGLLVFDTDFNSFWFYNGTIWVDLSSPTVTSNNVIDADSDTKIQVEESADEDQIRFDMGGTEYFKMNAGRLEVLNTGNSIFIGEEAGAVDDLSANNNSALGYQSMKSNTSGAYNSAFGGITLLANTSGERNTAMGFESLHKNTTGTKNTGIGMTTLYENTTGQENTAVGYEALRRNTTATGNTAIGGYSLNHNTTGYSNVATGSYALSSNSSGHHNSSFGASSMQSNTSGSYNTAMGLSSARNNKYGYYNVATGAFALFNNQSGHRNTAIGHSAGYNVIGSDNILIGYQINAPIYNGFGQLSIGNLIFGTGLGATGATISTGNVGIGTNSPGARLEIDGDLLMTGNNARFRFMRTSGWNYFDFYNGNNFIFRSIGTDDTGANNRMAITTNGNVGIATTAPTNKLSVNGSAGKTGGGSWATFSDRRLKTNVTDFTEGLDLLNKLHLVSFQYNSKYTELFGENEDVKNGKTYQGVIAQELQKVSPDMVESVNVDGTDYLQVDLSKLNMVLINAVLELQKEIEELKVQVAEKQ